MFCFVLKGLKKYLLLYECLGINSSSSKRQTEKNEKYITHFILNSDNDQILEQTIGLVVDLSTFISCLYRRHAVAEHKVLGSVPERMKVGGLSYPETQTMALMVFSDLQNLQICSEQGIMK